MINETLEPVDAPAQVGIDTWSVELELGGKDTKHEDLKVHITGGYKEACTKMLARLEAVISKSELDTWRYITQDPPRVGWRFVTCGQHSARMLRDGAVWGAVA